MTKLFDYVSCPNYTYEVISLGGRGWLEGRAVQLMVVVCVHL